MARGGTERHQFAYAMMLFPQDGRHRHPLAQRIAYGHALRRMQARRACPVPSPWRWMWLAGACLVVGWAIVTILTR